MIDILFFLLATFKFIEIIGGLGFWLTTLKFAAILLTGISGIAGLLVDYKDKAGNITPWGRRALVTVVVSTMIAAGLQGLEVWQGQKEQLAENEKTNRLLTAISRGVYLFRADDVTLDASATFPLDAPAMQDYRDRLEKHTSSILKTGKLPNGSLVRPGDLMNNEDMETGVTRPVALSISLAHPLAPLPSEKIAWRAVHPFGFNIRIYKTPVEWKYFQMNRDSVFLLRNDLSAKLDLILTPDLELTLTGEPRIDYEFGFGKASLQLHAEGMKITNKSDPKSKGTIVSLADLAGAQVVIEFIDYDTGSDAIDFPYLNAQKKASIDYLLWQSLGARVQLKPLKRVPKMAYPCYEYIFPSDFFTVGNPKQ